MAINNASFFADNIGSPAAGTQYGPWNLGSCTKMLHIVAGITVSFPGINLSPTGVLTYPLVWGCQWVPHGNSPLALPGFLFEPSFFFAEPAGDGIAVTAAWTPDTGSGAYIAGNVHRREWRGQTPINQNIDLYITTGTTNSSIGDWEASVVLKVTNTT